MAEEEGLSLDVYVEQTLLAIVGGVLRAQADAGCGPYVGRSPNRGADNVKVALDLHDNIVTLVSFDLATTVADKTERGGGLSIKVLPMLGGQLNARGELQSSSVSRIAFTVPVSIPKPQGQVDDDAARNRRLNSAMPRPTPDF